MEAEDREMLRKLNIHSSELNGFLFGSSNQGGFVRETNASLDDIKNAIYKQDEKREACFRQFADEMKYEFRSILDKLEGSGVVMNHKIEQSSAVINAKMEASDSAISSKLDGHITAVDVELDNLRRFKTKVVAYASVIGGAASFLGSELKAVILGK